MAEAAPKSQSEKESRTPTQRKIDSAVLFEVYRAQGLAEAKRVPPGNTGVRIDAKKRAYLDLRVGRAQFDSVVTAIESISGLIVATYPQDDVIYAWIPLLQIERIAALDAVKFVNAAPEPRR